MVFSDHGVASVVASSRTPFLHDRYKVLSKSGDAKTIEDTRAPHPDSNGHTCTKHDAGRREQARHTLTDMAPHRQTLIAI